MIVYSPRIGQLPERLISHLLTLPKESRITSDAVAAMFECTSKSVRNFMAKAINHQVILVDTDGAWNYYRLNPEIASSVSKDKQRLDLWLELPDEDPDLDYKRTWVNALDCPHPAFTTAAASVFQLGDHHG